MGGNQWRTGFVQSDDRDIHLFPTRQQNEHSLVGDNIHCITETKDENLWIASDLGGISLLDLHNFSTQNVENLEFKNITHLNSSLSSPNTRMIQEDKFGNVWIGNYSSGLDFISHNQSNFHIIPYFYEIGETKIRKRIYGVKANPDGTVWLGGENELSLYDGHQISRRVNLSTYMYRSYSVIYTIEKDKNNNLWLGINDEGVMCYNPQKDFFSHVDLDVDNLDIRVSMKMRTGQC